MILRSCVAVSPGLVAVLVAPFLGAASALANEPVCVAPNEYDWVVFGPVVRAFCGAAAAEPTPVADVFLLAVHDFRASDAFVAGRTLSWDIVPPGSKPVT